MKKYGFLILNYLDTKGTINCVTNILSKVKGTNTTIIIVDNASPNNAGIELKKHFSNYRNVNVICTSKNLGFANGNNHGFDYLKGNYNLDFLIVMNEDVRVHDNNFLENISKVYSETNFDVLGPDIISRKDKNHQNPLRYNSLSLKELCRWKNNMKKQYDRYMFFYLKKYIKKHIKKDNLIIKDYTKTLKNVVLQGSCIIFSKNFINSRKYLFYPETFMYLEEDILDYECKRDNYRVVYSPQISVEHLEDVSTNITFKNNYNKEKFKLKQMIKSANILIEYEKSDL